MKLDRRHMVVSVVLLVASIIYNVWIFTRPADGARPAASFAGGGQPAPSAQEPSAAGGPVDPAQVQELPDVALERPPQWPRDPFGSTHATAPDVAAVSDTALEVVPDPDPVVASILYSSDRRAAVIDGRVVRIGDMVGTSLVVDILPKSVVIESRDGGRQTLALKVPAARGGRP